MKLLSRIAALITFFAAYNVIAQIEVSDVKARKSILITEPTVLNNLQADHNFAFHLGRLNEWLIDVRSPDMRSAQRRRDRVRWAHGEFIDRMFQQGRNQQRSHASAPANNRLGAPGMQSRFFGAVNDSWMSPSDLSRVNSFNQLKNAPFRLMAISNRMDVAGDFDDRATIKDPRSLGELHLIYGLVDDDFEQREGKAFPMSFILTYKLPPLLVTQGRARIDNRFDDREILASDRRWRTKMSLWAQQWHALSNQNLRSSAYESGLREILDLIARPENFISVRSNTRIAQRESEFREWYINPASLGLTRRNIRGEPYQCLDDSRELAQVINYHWSGADSDLDMRSRHENYRGYRGQNGFVVPKDSITHPVLEGLEQFGDCGFNGRNAPFGMFGRTNRRGEALQVMFSAPFARVEDSFVWQVPRVPERRRHAFAIRTCSGCHGAEGVPDEGFHVSPRLGNQQAALSSFLTGRGRNTFTHDGTTYQYNELRARKEHFANFYNQTATVFDSLLRPELQ